jgi:hypothetical protein
VDEFTTPPAPPVVFTLAAGCLAQTGACLGGNVDPKNSPTTYYFEYGLDGSYGNAVPAGHDGDAGSEFGAGRVVERISNLTPNTTYHYRLVAENAAGPTFGPDMRFKTRPDSATTAQMEAGWQSRGTELVNPPDKGNQAVYPAQKAQPWISVSPDGNRVLWKTANGGPDSSTGALSNFISDYTPDGWTSHNVLPEASELPGGAGDNYFGTPLGFTPDFSSMLFLSARGVDKAHYSKTLIKVDDQRHATLLEEYDPLANANQLFEVSQPAAGGKAVVGGGTASPGGPYPLTIYGADGTARPVQVPACGYSQIIARTPENIPLVDLNSASSWVNADATRIFVYSSGDADCSAPPAIYMLEPDTGAATRISGEQNAAAGFLRANSAGTEVLFSKAGDLYKWSNEGGEECLSCGSGFEIKTGTASADLSHVYFCGPVPPASPPAVDCAIYVWRASGISFVAEKSEVPGKGVDEKRFPLQLDRSGDQMIFESTRPYVATADDTGWNGDLLFTGAAFTQLYRYDDTAGEVECLTCTDPVSGALPPPELTLVNNRPTLSADGQTIAFATSSRLTPADINGRFDVYEWHQGLFRLVTDGESEFEASLSGMPRVWGLSGDGRNLIFSAGGVAITGNEMDTYSNVYAARTGSAGFPPSLPPAHCVEDSCQGALESPPPLPPAASSSYAGAGNVPAAKRHKRKHKKARHHRRHKQGGKHKPKQSHKRGGQQ